MKPNIIFLFVISSIYISLYIYSIYISFTQTLLFDLLCQRLIFEANSSTIYNLGDIDASEEKKNCWSKKEKSV